ncbi:DEAD/DEAH box helicase [Leptospira bourretii]|nr:DEAD/DEAH box helicase [Leptospira bourretii]TGK90599.1 hypothetical protein EHQ26_10645 [Leptospira bourretii]
MVNHTLISLNRSFKNKLKDSPGASLTAFSAKEISDQGFINHIQSGYSWSVGVFKENYRKLDNFIESHLTALDFDKNFTLDEALNNEFFKKNASFIYTSASHTEEHHKFRVIFYFPTSITSMGEYNKLYAGLLALFPQADTSARDCARMFYGSSGAKIFHFDNSKMSEEVFESLKLTDIAVVKKERKKNKTSQPKRNIRKSVEPFNSNIADLNLNLVEEALSYIPSKARDDGRRSIFLKLYYALRSVISMTKAQDLLREKIDSNSTLDLDKLEDSYQYGYIGALFNEAKQYGWKARNYVYKSIKNINSGLSVPKNVTKILNVQYLSNALKNVFSNKFVLIQSLQGTGKTEFISKCLESKKIIYVIHRVELCKEIYNRLVSLGIEVELYSNLKSSVLKEFEQSIVICLDSIPKLNYEKYRNCIIIFDEYDQVFKHLFGKTCESKLQEIYSKMRDLVRVSKQVIAMSADSSRASLHFFKKCLNANNIEYIFNQYIPFKDRKVTIYSNKNIWLNKVIETVENGKKVSIACVKKCSTKRLYNELKELFPGKNILHITIDNKNYEQVKLCLEDSFEVLKYDIFIFSPVIGTGKDFNFEYSTENFLLADASNILSSTDCFQMSTRFRKFNHLHVFLHSRDKINYTEGDMKDGFMHRFRLFISKDKFYKQIMKHPAISEHTKGKYRPLFISKFLHDQEKIESAKGLFGYFLGLLYERGFSVSFNNDKTISDKSLVSKRRKLELEEYNQKVKNASDQVSEVTSKYITKNGACNEAEYYSNLKFHFKKLANFRANNQDSLKDFNFLVDSGNDCHYWLNKIQNFRLAFGSETFAQNLDSSEQYSKLKVQRNYYYNKHELLKQLLNHIPIDSIFCEENLVNLRKFLVLDKNCKMITENLFKVTFTHRLHMINFISSLLGKLGLSLKMVKKSNGKRFYIVDKESFDRMSRISQLNQTSEIRKTD